MSDNSAEKAWTMGQVRETFVRGREQHADFNGINNSRKEFERWLAAHDAELERQIQGWITSATEAMDKLRESEARRVELEAVIQAVRDLADKAEHGATRWADPLPVPEWVDRVRAVLTSPSTVLEEHDQEVAARERRRTAELIEQGGTRPGDQYGSLNEGSRSQWFSRGLAEAVRRIRVGDQNGEHA